MDSIRTAKNFHKTCLMGRYGLKLDCVLESYGLESAF